MTWLTLSDTNAAWPTTGAGAGVASGSSLPHRDATGAQILSVDPLSATSGAQLDLVPALDLQPFSELRLWVRAPRKANGSSRQPFRFELSYRDSADPPGVRHSWFLPVNREHRWEQRRIGIETDARSQITDVQIRAVTDDPAEIEFSELIAANPELLNDTETVLTARLSDITPPELSDLQFSAPAAAGDQAVTLTGTPNLLPGNLIRLLGGDAGEEQRVITTVAVVAGTTELSFVEPLQGNFALVTALASLSVPIFFEPPPANLAGVTPNIVMTSLDVREDIAQSLQYQQRDSFRVAGNTVQVSVRPAPRIYAADYQCTISAPDRQQQRVLHSTVLQRISRDLPLRIAGASHPVGVLPPPELPRSRPTGLPAPVYFRVHSPVEVAPRQPVPVVARSGIRVTPTRHRTDQSPALNFEEVETPR